METENICNMDNKATIKIYQSEETEKYYIEFIHHLKDKEKNGQWVDIEINQETVK